MSNDSQHDVTVAYSVRRFRPDDAQGVGDCFRRVYGDSYIHQELYDPEELIRQNQSGQTISVVAVEPSGRVVGHYALERPELGRIAEEGEALVLPECRHHHLMEDMRGLLEQVAREIGLTGLFGWAVTNHLYSQKTHDRFGLAPCAISLGALPRTFHNMPEPMPQRLSVLLGYKYLQPPAESVAYLPPRHRPICARIYEQLQLTVTVKDGVPAAGVGKMTVSASPELQTALIRIERIGADTAAKVSQERRKAVEQSGAATMFLELPLDDACAPNLCESAEADGFFFSGIGR